MTQPLGVILAGGLATRMGGGDKGLLRLGGQNLMSRVIGRLAPQVAGLALNANNCRLLTPTAPDTARCKGGAL